MSDLTYRKIDDVILNTLRPPSKGYWIVIFLLILGVLTGAACWAYQNVYPRYKPNS